MTSPTHTIRLRRPWQCRATGRGVVWRRGFQRPTGLDARTTVSLCLSGLAVGVRVVLNGQALGTADAGSEAVRFEITPLLAVRNELELESIGPVGPKAAASDEPPGEVVLEIGVEAEGGEA